MTAAVALFAKSPQPGQAKTRLIPPLSPSEAARVARACLEHTIREIVPAVAARWRLFWEGAPDPSLEALASSRGLTVHPQVEGDLGTRLRAAFRLLRGEGAERIVAIGSDSPTLEPGWIVDAIAALDSCDLVLGPAEDGGYYLIGLRGTTERVFENVPWGSDRVTAVTLERAREAKLTVRTLPRWYDLDDVASLVRARTDLAARDRLRRGSGPEPERSALAAALDALGARLEEPADPTRRGVHPIGKSGRERQEAS